jgi:hypothetical protein
MSRSPSISGNGGAVRYLRHLITHARAVLCHNGTILMRDGGAWKKTTYVSIHDLIKEDPAWQTDTSPSTRGAVTRTTRQARRLATPTS